MSSLRLSLSKKRNEAYETDGAISPYLKFFSLIIVRMFYYLAKVLSSYVVLSERNKKEKSFCTNRDAEMDG